MKTSIAIAALLSSATTFALRLSAPSISPMLWIPEATPTPLPAQIGENEAEELERRQATVHNVAPVAPTQAPTVTTNWVQTFINGATTYVPVVFTQTFPSEYMPYPPPMSGQIGLGTLTKEKRDAAPQPTVYLIPMEMVLQTVNVVEPIRPVLQVEVVQPVTVAMVSLVGATTPSSSSRSSLEMLSKQTGVLGTASMRAVNGSASASRTFMASFTAGTAWNGSYFRTM